MSAPNTQFELSVEDLEMIESALHLKKAELSLNSAGESEEARDLHNLLGRLHNQKEFYRPKSGAYVGG